MAPVSVAVRLVTEREAAAAHSAARAAGLLDRWLIAGTHRESTYPCRCVLGRRCSPVTCWCAGRVDLDALPARCCARKNTPAVTATAKAAADLRTQKRRGRKLPANPEIEGEQ